MKSRIPSLLSGSLLAAALISLSSGCAWSVGGSKGNSSCIPAQPTRGQELIDLKKAHDTGAISDEEYEGAKQRALQE